MYLAGACLLILWLMDVSSVNKAGLLDKHASFLCAHSSVLTDTWICIFSSFGDFGCCWECGEVDVMDSWEVYKGEKV
uniref:Uncharacterized protein n=1 Tax=Setaria viridis TaxID=4556 RepID=A0A4U6VPP0_SETVI|nr:hypothetical protein SEVIR_3G194850v2 [Setaria viridis]